MRRMHLDRWPLSLRATVALVATGIFTACCPKPSPAPEPLPDCPKGTAPSSPAQLDACLHGFRFDAAPEVSDSQPLTVIGKPPGAPCPGDEDKTRTCRYGPIAKIEPVIGAESFTDEALRQGRIIARISIPGKEKEGYGKYHLQAGDTTYWWVQVDARGTGGKSLYLTKSQVGKVEPEPHPLERYVYKKVERLGRAIARWVWSLQDETTQGTCGSGTCK